MVPLYIVLIEQTSMDDPTLSKLAMSPVFLFHEFIESGIEPIVARARDIPEEDRHEFYVTLLPHMVAHCKDIGVLLPYETAIFLINVVKCRV
jgi:hypothetical protein